MNTYQFYFNIRRKQVMTMLGRDKVLRDQMMLCTVIAKFNRGEINKNHPLQRKPNQWTSEAMSGLAASVIKGEYYPLAH